MVNCKDARGGPVVASIGGFVRAVKKRLFVTKRSCQSDVSGWPDLGSVKSRWRVLSRRRDKTRSDGVRLLASDKLLASPD